MTITIDLPPDLVTRLRERARERDSEAMRQLIADAATPAVEALLREPVDDLVRRADGLTDAEFEQLTEELLDTEFRTPNLPDHALTREGLYEDHL